MKCCSLQPASTSSLQSRQFFWKVALASIWYTQHANCLTEMWDAQLMLFQSMDQKCIWISVKFKSSAKNPKLKYIADLLGKPCLANPYKNTSHGPILSFQACLASPFGISCVPNSTVPQIHCSPARQALCSTSPVLETPVKIRPSSPNILFQAC